MQRNDIQPVVQILPKGPALHHLLQIAIGGGDNPHIHPHIAHAPQPFESRSLDDPQQLGLQFRRGIADLIKKNRPSIRKGK